MPSQLPPVPPQHVVGMAVLYRTTITGTLHEGLYVFLYVEVTGWES